jgi:hypothetical protein
MGQKANNKAILPWFLYRERNLTEQDYIDTKLFFSSIGYDTSKSIHEQFMEKYNLSLIK